MKSIIIGVIPVIWLMEDIYRRETVTAMMVAYGVDTR
jgi:hypothetical protein